MTQDAQNLDNLSLEDVIALVPATEEVGDIPANGDITPVTQESKPQSRDEQGRFTSDKQTFKRTIDLGDGSGVQVFEADSADALLDKLADAQLNATRKIRELTKHVPAQVTKPVEFQFSAEDEALITSEILANPTKAIQAAFEKITGMSVSDFRSTTEAMKEYRAASARGNAVQDFLNATPDFYDSEKNSKKIQRYLDTQGLSYSTESLKQAYQDLHESGLLESKPVTTQQTNQGTSDALSISSGSQGRQKARAGSGLSSGNSSVPPVIDVEAELDKLPIEEVMKLVPRK
jgi:hypothetical protein